VTFNTICGKNRANKFCQIIPRVMPAIVPEQTLKERFDDENYVRDIENLFREKFLQNLGVS
jgi:hypothetical protein